MLRNRSVLMITTLVAGLSLSAPALAAPSVDTLITHGYDADSMSLVFGFSPAEGESADVPGCGFDGERAVEPTADTAPNTTVVEVDDETPRGKNKDT